MTAVRGSINYRRYGSRHVLYVAVTGTATEALDVENQLFLGADEGLRGYGSRYQSGTASALTTVEWRLYTDWYPFRGLVNVGGALFFDAGRTWGRDVAGVEPLGMLKDIGLDRGDYGIIYGTFGIAASITGGLVGGYLIGKFGLRRVVWPLVLAQNVPNLLYSALALAHRDLIGHPELGAASPYAVAPFVIVEAFGAGMGTSLFMVFIMRTTGEVTLRLYKGGLEPVCRKSPNSLYSLDIASFTMGASDDQKDALGFINLIGLPVKVRALKAAAGRA